jgi:6-phosphofructokinase 2
MKKIITLTINPSIDKSTSIEQVVANKKLRCDAPYFEPGGGGINVSRAIHRLGGSSLAYYTMGGISGQRFSDILQEEGIEQKTFMVQENTRENFAVFEKATGQQYRFIMPGPELSESEWKRCLEDFENHVQRGNFSYIVASGSLPPNVPPDFFERLAHFTNEKDARLVIDTSGDALRAAVKEGVYLLKPNLRELAQLSGHDIEDEPEQEKAARTIVDRGQAEVVVVSMGAAGAMLVSKQTAKYIPAPTVKIRSKIGAGDSMVAGIVLALVRGKSLYQAVRFGVAAGSAAVMLPGTELCRREDTERLYKKMIDIE